MRPALDKHAWGALQEAKSACVVLAANTKSVEEFRAGK